MTLTKLEQSGFILETDKGFRVAIDVASLTPIEKLAGIRADAALASHIHGDHFSFDHLQRLSPKTVYLNEECIEAIGEQQPNFEIVQVRVGETLDIGEVKVQFFNVDHGPNVTAPLRENFGFLIQADGKKIYFAGDMFYASGIDVTNLEVDFALLPVGGHYTFGPNEALEFASEFKKIETVIPMHFEMRKEARDEFVTLAHGKIDAVVQ